MTDHEHPTARPMRHESAGRAAVALFALGMTAGMLVLLIAFALFPEREDPTTAEFRAVREFAEEHFVREVDSEELMTRALKGMLDDLDPYSRYYDRVNSERVRREIEGDFRGIGVVFRAPVDEGQVLFPVANSPAGEAGVRVGDRILTVDGAPITGLDFDAIQDRLTPRGERYVDVRVVGLDGVTRDLTIEPRILIDPTVRHAELLDAAPEVGYLTVRAFSNNTADEFDAAVMTLRAAGAKALIVDLRYNYGGVLDAAVQMVGRFIEDGVVVSSEGRVQREVHRADDVEAAFAGMPLVVLVNGDSASASEVFAGALQDHRAAVLVGEPTYGKGMLQTTRSFPQFGSRAKVTSAYFYSPSRRNFERTSEEGRQYGIQPDLLVPLETKVLAKIYAWIVRYDVPSAAIDDLIAWDAEEGGTILPTPPPDPQLDAAIALLTGKRPAPSRLPTPKD